MNTKIQSNCLNLLRMLHIKSIFDESDLSLTMLKIPSTLGEVKYFSNFHVKDCPNIITIQQYCSIAFHFFFFIAVDNKAFWQQCITLTVTDYISGDIQPGVNGPREN